jgi:hypothetical protein
VKTKSGIMVGLGETDEEILQVMRDMREHNIDMLTIGQYLAPSNSHLPVRRYVHPDVFKMFEEEAYKMGFKHAAVGAMVRSSYHADQQAHNDCVRARKNTRRASACPPGKNIFQGLRSDAVRRTSRSSSSARIRITRPARRWAFASRFPDGNAPAAQPAEHLPGIGTTTWASSARANRSVGLGRSKACSC